MKYYPAIFVLEPFHKEFLISLLIGKFLYLLQKLIVITFLSVACNVNFIMNLINYLQ